MTFVNRIVKSSHPASLKSLQALSAVVGLEEGISFSTVAADGDYAVEITVHVNHAFGSTTSQSISGFVNCARSICMAVPESDFWGNDTSVEKWIDAAVKALVVPAYVAPSDEGKKILEIYSPMV